MAKRERSYEWFMEPLDDFTNKAIVSVLADQCQSDESRRSVLMPDNEGEPHNVWQVNYDTIAKFQRSTGSGYRFRAFVREGGRGPIRRWNFSPDRKRRAHVVRGCS